MRLTSLKLSGFKSFAEPTQFQVPGQMVAVVGPNGCGKSNIIDAVRWVLGESRASELRGESMQDVIFNGSNHRKPASRASVELVFDNSSHRAGGQWNQYGEIAVRRVLTRDGTSSYYINGQTVRRRDVQDVFLGTGLGPRAYAIIGQGTISRIIESRPEDLRLFLEEAAGVSKYKERRRETENRLADTRDNLTRVSDILREQATVLDKLERQAEVAARYQKLQADMALRQQQLWWLLQRDAGDGRDRLAAQIAEAQAALEARTVDLRKTETDLENIRQAHYAAGDAVNQAQGKLYEASAEVGKLEAAIRYVSDSRERSERRLSELQSQMTDWEERRQSAESDIETTAGALETAAEQLELLAAQSEDEGTRVPELEEALNRRQREADAQRNAVLEVQQQIQLLAAEQRSIDEQAHALEQRRARLAGERGGLVLPDEERLAEMRLRLGESEQSHAIAQAQLEELAQQVPQLDSERQQRQSHASEVSQRQAEVAARLEALRTLQEKVRTEGKLHPWLVKHGLDSLSELWQRLHVEPGWEPALEAALRERLRALQVGKIERLQAFAGDTPPARLVFFEEPPVAAPQAPGDRRPLADVLQLSDPTLRTLVTDWLAGWWAAPTLAEALAQRAALGAGEAFCVPAGHVVTRHSVSFYAPDSEQSGVLARQQEIENLEKENRAQTLMVEEARSALVRAEANYADAVQRLSSLRREAAGAQDALHRLQVDTLRLEQQAESAQARARQLDEDLAEVDATAESLQERRVAAEARFEELDLALANEQERHARLDETVTAAQRALGQGREQVHALERRSQEAQFSVRTLQARQEELTRAVAMADQQLASFVSERERVAAELERLRGETANTGLQQALEDKAACEQRLALARAEYDDLTQRLRGADELRMQTERTLDPQRQRITELQLKEQESRLGAEQYARKLEESGADVEAVALSIVQEAIEPASLPAQIDRLQRSISALGAVNLAALEELAAARERKAYLDTQYADLTDAMTTLEDAIRKIDAETRELLATTFNSVNEQFGIMFPELFGGGHARLVMTGDEILDAGVQVMAQPPGKKNSTIHLLSGGEKALTAIALVFAIFQLNPAPFCLLDEVDAPLDDANTERYARLVASMSTRGTQFLYISHNKIAMEKAEQLVGVTMQEQGVSRIVAVDMEAAVSMAQT